MQAVRSEIRAQLEREILPLQGFKPLLHSAVRDVGIGAIRYSFPNSVFPIGAIHEFICDDPVSGAATAGFVCGITSKLMRNSGMSVWISPSPLIHPPALVNFGIQPEKMIFIHPKKEKDLFWCVEEALKCKGISAVIGDLPHLDFTQSRRLQLAVEQSQVTGFIFRHHPKSLTTSAALARWKIKSLPSSADDQLPGVSFPRWQVELLKVRNGRPGLWEVEWKNGSFEILKKQSVVTETLHRKTG